MRSPNGEGSERRGTPVTGRAADAGRPGTDLLAAERGDKTPCLLCLDLVSFPALSQNLPTYLPIFLPIHLSTYLPIYLSTYLPTYLPTYLQAREHAGMQARRHAGTQARRPFPRVGVRLRGPGRARTWTPVPRLTRSPWRKRRPLSAPGAAWPARGRGGAVVSRKFPLQLCWDPAATRNAAIFLPPASLTARVLRVESPGAARGRLPRKPRSRGLERTASLPSLRSFSVEPKRGVSKPTV